MRSIEKITIPSTHESIICDECKTHIKEYGNSWLTLESNVGEFRDDTGETSIYDFCDSKCLSTWLITHTEPNIAKSDFITK